MIGSATAATPSTRLPSHFPQPTAIDTGLLGLPVGQERRRLLSSFCAHSDQYLAGAWPPAAVVAAGPVRRETGSRGGCRLRRGGSRRGTPSWPAHLGCRPESRGSRCGVSA